MDTSASDREVLPYLLIHESDNVIVAVAPICKNVILKIGENILTVNDRIELGHKIALQQIPAGEKVIKCGTVIGSATTLIRPGDHVHLHNMKSDYLPTYTLNDAYQE